MVVPNTTCVVSDTDDRVFQSVWPPWREEHSEFWIEEHFDPVVGIGQEAYKVV